VLEISRDLLCGSAGRECPGQTDDDNFLASSASLEFDLHRRMAI